MVDSPGSVGIGEFVSGVFDTRSYPRSVRHVLVGHDVTVAGSPDPTRRHRVLDVMYSDHRSRWEFLVLDHETHTLNNVSAHRCTVLRPDTDRRTFVL